jgi:hypothetical protein
VCQAISFLKIKRKYTAFLVASGSGPFAKAGSYHFQKKDGVLKSANLVVMGYEPFAHTYPTLHTS